MTVLPSFGNRLTPGVKNSLSFCPMVRCDRCGKEVPIPRGPLFDKCDADRYKEYLVRRDSSERGWLDQPALTDEYIINELNLEMWCGRDPHPMLREALGPLGFVLDGDYKRTVCGECRAALEPKYKRYFAQRELLGKHIGYPVVWLWPEDDVPEPMEYQRGAETMASYLDRRAERKALKDAGKDPDATPRYRLVYEGNAPQFGSRNLICEELSDDWEESVWMAKACGPFRIGSACFIADMAEMKRIRREEWE